MNGDKNLRCGSGSTLRPNLTVSSLRPITLLLSLMPDIVLSRHGTAPITVGPTGIGRLTDIAISLGFSPPNIRAFTLPQTQRVYCYHGDERRSLNQRK